MLKKIISIVSVLFLMVFVAFAVYTLLGSLGGPVMKPAFVIPPQNTVEKAPQVIQPYMIVQKMRKYNICGDVELYYRGPADQELVGMDYNRLKMQFPKANGWEVSFKDDEIHLTREIAGFCGLHKEYRHLGIHDGQVAVYQGPLGYDGTLLRLERNISIDMLPEDWRDKLEKAARFNDLSWDEQKELRETIEFPDEFTLNMVLENFDEMD